MEGARSRSGSAGGVDRLREGRGQGADGLGREGPGEETGPQGDVALHGVRQGVQAAGGEERHREALHQGRVEEGQLRLGRAEAPLAGCRPEVEGDHRPSGRLRSGAGGGGEGEEGDAGLLRPGAAHVGRPVPHPAPVGAQHPGRLGGVDHAPAPDGDQQLRAPLAGRAGAGLGLGVPGVGADGVEHLVGHPRPAQGLLHRLGQPGPPHAGVGHQQGPPVPGGLRPGPDLGPAVPPEYGLGGHDKAGHPDPSSPGWRGVSRRTHPACRGARRRSV